MHEWRLSWPLSLVTCCDAGTGYAQSDMLYPFMNELSLMSLLRARLFSSRFFPFSQGTASPHLPSGAHPLLTFFQLARPHFSLPPSLPPSQAFAEMCSHEAPVTESYNALMFALTRSNTNTTVGSTGSSGSSSSSSSSMERAQQLLREMQARGMQPDGVTYEHLIRGYLRAGEMVVPHRL